MILLVCWFIQSLYLHLSLFCNRSYECNKSMSGSSGNALCPSCLAPLWKLLSPFCYNLKQWCCWLMNLFIETKVTPFLQGEKVWANYVLFLQFCTCWLERRPMLNWSSQELNHGLAWFRQLDRQLGNWNTGINSWIIILIRMSDISIPMEDFIPH